MKRPETCDWKNCERENPKNPVSIRLASASFLCDECFQELQSNLEVSEWGAA